MYVYWSGSNGIIVPLGANYLDIYKNTAECLDEIVSWMITEYGPEKALIIAIEPKTNEPPAWSVPADVGEALTIVSMMSPENQPFVGVNPETCHSQIGGKRYAMELGLAMAAGRLFHTHLNGGSGFKFDEDRAFGDIDFGVAVETVITLREGNYCGAIGFDVQPLPSDTDDQQCASVERSVKNLKRAIIIANSVDMEELTSFRWTGDNASIAEWFADAVCGIEDDIVNDFEF